MADNWWDAAPVVEKRQSKKAEQAARTHGGPYQGRGGLERAVAQAQAKADEERNKSFTQKAGETGADFAAGGSLLGQVLDPLTAAAGVVGSYVVPHTGSGSPRERFGNEMSHLRQARAKALERSPKAFIAGALLPALKGGAPVVTPASDIASKLGPGIAQTLVKGAAGVADASLYNAASAAAGNIDQDPVEAARKAAKSPWNLVGAAPAAVAHVAKPAANVLDDVAVASGRRVLTNGADSLSTRKPIDAEAVKEAIRSGGIKAFGTTQGALQRLSKLTDDQAAMYSEMVKKLEDAGVPGPDALSLADDIFQRGNVVKQNSANKAEQAVYFDAADDTLTKADPAGRIGLGQSENVKRSYQKMADYDRTVTKPVNTARQEVASMFRRANEAEVERAAQAADEGSPVRSLAEDFVPVKQKLGRLIEARKAAGRGAARVAQRGAMSLTDTVLAAGGVASGNPQGIAQGVGAGLLNNLFRNRGRSAVASGALGLADALRGPVNPNVSARALPLSMGKETKERLTLRPDPGAWWETSPVVE